MPTHLRTALIASACLLILGVLSIWQAVQQSPILDDTCSTVPRGHFCINGGLVKP